MISKSLMTFLIVALVVLQPLKVDAEGFEEHFDEYSHLNHAHHDNIDDAPSENHVHKHKHREDGEEHEHHHGHTKVSHSEVNLLSQYGNYSILPDVIESISGFFESSMFSDPHIQGLFRPPIV